MHDELIRVAQTPCCPESVSSRSSSHGKRRSSLDPDGWAKDSGIDHLMFMQIMRWVDGDVM